MLETYLVFENKYALVLRVIAVKIYFCKKQEFGDLLWNLAYLQVFAFSLV
jgi:hypothetical protein